MPLPAFWALPEPTLSAACLLNSWFSKRERPQARSAPESHTDNCKFFRRFLADRCPGRRGGRQPARMPLPSIRSAYRGRVQAVLRRLRRPAMTAQPHQSRAEQGERPRLGNGDGARCAVDPARSILSTKGGRHKCNHSRQRVWSGAGIPNSNVAVGAGTRETCLPKQRWRCKRPVSWIKISLHCFRPTRRQIECRGI